MYYNIKFIRSAMKKTPTRTPIGVLIRAKYLFLKEFGTCRITICLYGDKIDSGCEISHINYLMV